MTSVVLNLKLAIRGLAWIAEFLALPPLSQVRDSDRAIFLFAEVALNQQFTSKLAVILLDMKIAAVFG